MTDFFFFLPKLRQPARWASHRGNIWIISTWKQRDIDILPSTARYEQTFPVSLRGQTQLHRICINTGSFSPCACLVAEQSLPNMFVHRYLHTSPSLQPGRARAIARWGCKFLCPADEGLTSNARREACVSCTNEFTKFFGLTEGLGGYRLVLPYLVANLKWPIFAGASQS